jgi:aspartate aminotransferase
MKLSSYVNIPPSATLAMNALAAEKKRKGERVFNLTVGEPMVESSHFIFEAAVQAMNDGKTFYPPAAGIPELRSEVANWINTQFQSNFVKENVLVSCGAKHGLLMALQALLENGDEVLIVAPYWVSYPPMTTLAGGKAVILETSFENGWKLRPETIQAAVTPRTKVLILNNGGNPTGILYSKEEILAILETCKKNNIVVISDEVYSGLTFDQNEFISVASFPEYAESTVVIQSASKHFAMTGWRVGFVLGPKNLITALETLQSQSTTGTSSISQWATLGAIQHADEITSNIKKEIQSRRDAFVQNFEKYFGVKITVPACGLYAFVPLTSFGVSETDSVKFCMEILEKANVVFVPGAPFGAEGFVRASFGGKVEDVAEGLKVLAEYLKK